MYAVAQNKGNSEAMADAIRCIPYHAFNDHSKCGTRCDYLHDTENYDNKIVPEGLNDQRLFEGLRDIFQKIASTADKLSCSASSNVNESLNATMASKARKSRCYSMTASTDFRFTCTAGRKLD
jgi:hypothetical protein